MERREKQLEMQKRVYNLIDRMSKRIGINIPRQEYPKINFTNSKIASYNLAFNIIEFPYSASHSGDVLGEEIAHFIRDRIRTTQIRKPFPIFFYYLLHPFGDELDRVQSTLEKDKRTDEFLGYLGRKILEEVAEPKDELEFNKGLHSQYRKKRIQRLKEIRTKKNTFDYKGLKEERRDILEHQRAYEFAESFDLSNISDYSQLFSMPDQEVRHRFFRSDPQYDLTEPIQQGKITKRTRKIQGESGLEKSLKLIGTIGIFILFIISINPKNLTGYIINIKDNPINLNSIMIITMIVLLIIGIIFTLFFKKTRLNK